MKQSVYILLLALAATAIIGIGAGPELWAAPGQSPYRQTVPTRTPTPGATSLPTAKPTSKPISPPTTVPTVPPPTIPTQTATVTSEIPSTLTSTLGTLIVPTATLAIVPTEKPAVSDTGTETAIFDTAIPTMTAKEAEPATSTPSQLTPTDEIQGNPPSCWGSFSLLLCIGAGLVLIGVIMLIVWRQREK